MVSISLEDISVMIDADPKRAQRHGENYILRTHSGKRFDFCKTTPAELGIGGIGLEMYFVFLKQMIILFTVMSVISLPVVVINYMGGYLNVVETTSPFEASTIANQKGIPPGTINRTEAEIAVEEHRKYMYTTIVLDLFYCLAYIILIFFFEQYNKRMVKATRNLKVGDYAVEIEIKQRGETTEADLKRFFEKYGDVHECMIAEHYGRELQACMDYIQIEKNIREEQRKKESLDLSQRVDLLKMEREAALQKVKECSESSPESIRAFIIFESIKSREACLKEYVEYRSRKTLVTQPLTLRFQGSSLRVVKAPEPREIYWENFGITQSNWKSILVYLVVGVLMLVSLLVISIVEYYENRLPTYVRCLEFHNPFDSNNSTNTSDPLSDEQVICFCGGFEEREVSLAYNCFNRSQITRITHDSVHATGNSSI